MRTFSIQRQPSNIHPSQHLRAPQRLHINPNRLLEIRRVETPIRLRRVNDIRRIRRPGFRLLADFFIGEMTRAAIYTNRLVFKFKFYSVLIP